VQNRSPAGSCSPCLFPHCLLSLSGGLNTRVGGLLHWNFSLLSPKRVLQNILCFQINRKCKTLFFKILGLIFNTCLSHFVLNKKHTELYKWGKNWNESKQASSTKFSFLVETTYKCFEPIFLFFPPKNKSFRCKLAHPSAGKHNTGWGKDRLFLNLGTQWLKNPTQRTQPSCRAPGHAVGSLPGPAGKSSARCLSGTYSGQGTQRHGTLAALLSPRCSAESWPGIEPLPHSSDKILQAALKTKAH